MGDLIRVFERFLGRDLVYILAGAIPSICVGRILWAQGYLCKIASLNDIVSLKEVSWVWIALAVGATYVLGYMLQELFCLMRLSSTAIEGEPGKFVRRLFEWSQNKKWPEHELKFNGLNGELLAQIKLQKSNHKSLEMHAERLTYLMQIGTALGPACIVGGGALLFVWWLGYQNVGTCDRNVGVGLLAAGSIFLILGALKRAQLREYVFRTSESLQRNN